MRYSVRGALGLALGVLLVGSTAFAAFSPLKLDRVHSKVSFTAATVLFDLSISETDRPAQTKRSGLR